MKNKKIEDLVTDLEINSKSDSALYEKIEVSDEYKKEWNTNLVLPKELTHEILSEVFVLGCLCGDIANRQNIEGYKFHNNFKKLIDNEEQFLEILRVALNRKDITLLSILEDKI